MHTFNKNWLLITLLGVYVFYAGMYIYKTSFVIEGIRYFVLFDDAMISMRYARNFAEGYGLVWNPGETPVEGYTNPLWVIFMSFFHLFPIPVSKVSLAIQISGGIFLGLNLIFVKKITENISNEFIPPFLAVLLTAFYTPLNNWGLQGMEVSILVLLLNAAVLIMLFEIRNDRFSPWPYLLLGFGTLVRVDMTVPYLVLVGFAFLFVPRHRWRRLAWGLGLLAAFLASQTLFRLWYYGDPLPNTYYLKMSGIPLLLRIQRGLYVFYQFGRDLNWMLLTLPFIHLIFERDRKTFLLALLFVGQVAYSVYVGGDAWEHKGGANRYIAIAMPAFFTLFVVCVDRILQAIRRQFSRLEPVFVNLILVGFTLASLANFNFIRRDTAYLRRWLLLQPPIFIEGNKEDTRIALAVRKSTTPQASIAVVTAGAIPYFADRPAIDLLGKNDPYIAHLPSHTPASLEDIRPGHMKWDYDYSIGQLEPDMIVQLWGDKEIAYAYIQQYYTVVEIDGMLFSARSDSPNILWGRVGQAP